VPALQVARLLREGAQHHARRAVQTFQAEDGFAQLDAAAHAGSAVELTAKACIATVEPAALAKPVGSREGLDAAEHILMLRGHGHRLTDRPSGLNTIDASVALRIAAKMFDELGRTSIAARCALGVRNSALHMGTVDPREMRRAVAAMADFVRTAIPILNVETSEFWGESEDEATADQILEDRAVELATVVEFKISSASDRLERMRIRLGESEVQALARRALRELDSKDDSGYAYRCPACENSGWVDIDVDVDMEPDGEGGYDYWVTDSWVAGFRCTVCGLDLDGEEAIEAGIATGESD